MTPEYQVDAVRFRLGGFRVGDRVYDPDLVGTFGAGIVIEIDESTVEFRWSRGSSNHTLRTLISDAAKKMRPWRDR